MIYLKMKKLLMTTIKIMMIETGDKKILMNKKF